MTEKIRVSWEKYFMNISSEVSTRSTCDRKYVGAVIVRDKTILSTSPDSKKYEAVSEIKFAQQLFGHHQPKKEQPKPQ